MNRLHTLLLPFLLLATVGFCTTVHADELKDISQLASQGQYDKASLALEKAIKTHPSYATAHENLGDIYAKMASDAYDKALQLDSSNARAKTKLSLVKELFSSGNIGSASTPKPEEPAKIKVAAAAPPPAVAPAPAETAKLPEPKAKPASASVAKEKDKPVENPSPKEEPKVGSQQAVLETVEGWARA
jgi:tetratricopeptide (TPR) repeat protein